MDLKELIPFLIFIAVMVVNLAASIGKKKKAETKRAQKRVAPVSIPPISKTPPRPQPTLFEKQADAPGPKREEKPIWEEFFKDISEEVEKSLRPAAPKPAEPPMPIPRREDRPRPVNRKRLAKPQPQSESRPTAPKPARQAKSSRPPKPRGKTVPAKEAYAHAIQPVASRPTGEALRQAIVWAEILGPPVSLRPPGPRRPQR